MTLLYDALCPLCIASVAWVARHDRSGSVRILALDPAAMAAFGIPPANGLNAVQLVGVDATRVEGAQALLAVLAQLPRLRWTRHLGRIPGSMAVLQFLYRQVASRRRTVS